MTRAISTATLRRSRSACTRSTADRKRAWRKVLGHASATCIFSWSSRPSLAHSSKAAAASANRITSSDSYGHAGSVTGTGVMPRRFTDASAARSTSVAGASSIHAGT